MKISKAEYDALPDALKALFVEDGDGYVKTFATADEVKGLKEQNERLVQEKRDAKAKETAAEKAAREAAEAAARKNGDFEAMDKSWSEKYAALEGKYSELQKSSTQTIHGLTVGAKVAALGASIFGGNAHLGEHVLRSRLGLNDQNQVVVLDKDGKPSALTEAELEKEIRSDARYAAIVAEPLSSGVPSGRKGTQTEAVKLEAKNGQLDNLDIARRAIQDAAQD